MRHSLIHCHGFFPLEKYKRFAYGRCFDWSTIVESVSDNKIRDIRMEMLRKIILSSKSMRRRVLNVETIVTIL